MAMNGLKLSRVIKMCIRDSPTLVSFAIAPAQADKLVTPEFKKSDDPVYLFTAPKGDYAGTLELWERFYQLCQSGKVRSAWALTSGGVAEGLMKMCFGNRCV